MFLDLNWDDCFQGRIYLRLFQNSQRGEQFLSLCSGERGPCYKGTCFYHSHNGFGKRIEGGDYECNNGSGGKAIIENLDRYERQRCYVVKGLVAGINKNKSASTLFTIYTEDLPGYIEDTGFGIVEEGLNVLKSAIKHSPIYDVLIEDCGIAGSI